MSIYKSINQLTAQTLSKVKASPFLKSQYAFINTSALICFTLLMLWSFSLTASGLAEAGFLPHNRYVPEALVPFIAAGLIQSIISLFYLSIGFHHKRVINESLIIIAGALFFILLSVYFSLIGISKVESSGRLQYQIADSSQYQQRVEQISNEIIAIYNRRVKSLEDLATRAAAGKDRSGIKGCGGICKGHIAKANKVRETYGPLLSTAPQFGTPQSTDAVTALNTVIANIGALKIQFSHLQEFAKDQKISVAQTYASIEKLEKDIERRQASFSGAIPDERSVNIAGVSDGLRNIFEGKWDPVFVFKFAIAITPDIGALIIALILSITKGRSLDAVAYRGQASTMQQEHDAIIELLAIAPVAAKKKKEVISELQKHMLQEDMQMGALATIADAIEQDNKTVVPHPKKQGLKQ